MTLDAAPPEDEARPRHAFAGGLIVTALVALFLANAAFLYHNWSQMKPVPRGSTAPNIRVPLLGGGDFRLEAERGHPVFVDFWATWCGPCRESLPILDRVYQEHRAAGLRVVAIETEGQEAGARDMARRLGLTMPIGLGDAELSATYNITTIPYLVLINKHGQLHRVFRGVHSQAELTRAFRDADAAP